MNGSERNDLLRMAEAAKDGYLGNLDEYLTTVCLTHTMGQIVERREHAGNTVEYFVMSLIFNAVFDLDIGCIDQIITRIDGTAPAKSERNQYANLMGTALDEVMALPSAEQLQIVPEDKVLTALAKALIYLSTRGVGNNPTQRRDRQKAVETVFQRTSGRRNEPVKETVMLEYVEPDWMKGLPDG